MFSTLISWNRWNEMSQFPHLLLSVAADFANFFDVLVWVTHWQWHIKWNWMSTECYDCLWWDPFDFITIHFPLIWTSSLRFPTSWSVSAWFHCQLQSEPERSFFSGSHGNKPDEQWVTLQLISTPCVAFWFLSELNVHIHFKRLWFSSKKCIAHSSPPNVKCEVIMTENDSILDPAATPERWNNWQKKTFTNLKAVPLDERHSYSARMLNAQHSRSEQAFKFICTWWTAE